VEHRRLPSPVGGLAPKQGQNGPCYHRVCSLGKNIAISAQPLRWCQSSAVTVLQFSLGSGLTAGCGSALLAPPLGVPRWPHTAAGHQSRREAHRRKLQPHGAVALAAIALRWPAHLHLPVRTSDRTTVSRSAGFRLLTNCATPYRHR